MYILKNYMIRKNVLESLSVLVINQYDCVLQKICKLFLSIITHKSCPFLTLKDAS